jgi:hypothetical protein
MQLAVKGAARQAGPSSGRRLFPLDVFLLFPGKGRGKRGVVGGGKCVGVKTGGAEGIVLGHLQMEMAKDAKDLGGLAGCSCSCPLALGAVLPL